MEKQSGFDLHDVALTAVKDGGGGFVLNGEKTLVGQGDSADKFIVSARVKGERRDRDGIGLFLVGADAPGVSRRGYPTQDGQRAAEVSFVDVRVAQQDVLGAPGGALPAIERAVDETIAALAAEAVGAMSEALAMTVEYLKTRKQFGVTIGSFQALQHRAADMTVALEQARSMMYLAAMAADEDDAAERAQDDVRGEGANRPLGQVHRPAGSANAWRHRDDLRIQGRPPVQATDDDRCGLWRRGRSRATPRRPQQPVRLTLVELSAYDPCHRIRAVRR